MLPVEYLHLEMNLAHPHGFRAASVPRPLCGPLQFLVQLSCQLWVFGAQNMPTGLCGGMHIYSLIKSSFNIGYFARRDWRWMTFADHARLPQRTKSNIKERLGSNCTSQQA